MAFKFILTEINKGTLYIRINRPEALNALNKQVMREIKDVLQQNIENFDVSGVVITGVGDKSFVAGADIKELATKNAVSAKEFSVATLATLNYIEQYPKPVIAAINGYCLGGGCELAMACHIRLASDKARFGQPEVSLGIIPGNGGTQRLPRLVGKGVAMELVLTGNMIDAAEAFRIGLVNKVTEAEKLIEACDAMLAAIYSKGPVAVKLAIEAINHGMETTLNEGLQLEANLFGMCFSTEDKTEGINAFIEKRKPEFKGK